jgi:hypothetical protein
MNPRPSKDPAVNDYLDAVDSSLRPLFVAVRETILSADPALAEAIKWRDSLTYSAGSNIIQTVVGEGKISLVFFDGASLPDPRGLLEGGGRAARTVRITSLAYDDAALTVLVRDAAALARGRS